MALFVTAIYDLYAGAECDPESRTDAIWDRLSPISWALPQLHVFTDHEHLVEGTHITSEVLPLTDTHTFRMLGHTHGLPTHRNVMKDTADYLKLQCTKAEFLRRAADRHPDAKALIWIDAGISKIIPGDPAIIAYQVRLNAALLASAPGTSVVIPGCWPQRPLVASEAAECVLWRFCGGLCFVPKSLVNAFETATQASCLEVANVTGRLTWEVNIWALMEHSKGISFEWHRGDDNVSMFDFLVSKWQPMCQ